MPTAVVSRENGRKGGRPPGSLNKRTVLAAEMARVEGKLSPLQVMQRNLDFWAEKAVELGSLLEEKLAAEVTVLEKQIDPKDKESLKEFRLLKMEAIEVANKFIEAIDRSQSVAVDYAPYRHSRIESVPPEKDESKSNATEFSAAIGPTQLRLVSDNSK